MKILVACECSGIVRDAFISRGHNAISCDIQPTERPGPHYQGDVMDILYSEEWDMIIAHPDCTYLTNSGVRWLFQDCKKGSASERWEQMQKAAAFFQKFVDHPCKKKCIENPIPHKHAGLPQYTQTVQIYDFAGETLSKRTALWLTGLPELVPTQVLPKEMRTYDVWLESPGPERAKNRSRTRPGFAYAMAYQWG